MLFLLYHAAFLQVALHPSLSALCGKGGTSRKDLGGGVASLTTAIVQL